MFAPTIVAVFKHSKSVLIVDDNDLVRSALRGFLEKRTSLLVCGEAADGTEAVRVAKELEPGLVLMDLSMPQMNGIEAALLIRKAMPETRIVIFTMYSDLVGKALATKAGIDLVVPKAEGAEGLMSALRPLLDSSASASV